jgi:hypothetical protein
MSLLTVLLLFFSRSFTSLHDRTFEKTMFDAVESFTGNNNITLITLLLLAHWSEDFLIIFQFFSLSLKSSFKFFFPSSASTQNYLNASEIIQIALGTVCVRVRVRSHATITLQICRMTKIPKKAKERRI